MTPSLGVRALTPEEWPALEDLFDTSGPVGRCWCMYWRIGAAYRHREPEANRHDFRSVVESGPPPGLLAFDGELAVGWCQITARAAIPEMDRQWGLKRADDASVWAISCFYVRRQYRQRGVATLLAEAAITFAADRGAVAVEAYPVDAAVSPTSSHTGFASTFERLGFRTIAQHHQSRPMMRLDLQSTESQNPRPAPSSR